MYQSIEFKGETGSQNEYDAVGTTASLLPPLELLIDRSILIEKPKVHEIEHNQQPYPHSAANHTQKGSLVVIRPIYQLKSQEQTPAQQLHQRYQSAQRSLQVHLLMETFENDTHYEHSHGCNAEREVYYFCTFAELLIVDRRRHAGQEIIADHQLTRTGGIAAVVIEIHACIAHTA